jgi:hypothetical protein
MKRLLSFALLVLFVPLTAHADDASKRAKVQEMLDLMHVDKTMAQVMDMVKQQTTSMTAHMMGANISPEQKASISDLQQRIFDFVESQVGWKVMQPQYVDLYVATFSEDEIDGILAFYKSPAGQAIIAKTPELTQKSMVMVQQKLATLQPQIQQMIDDFVRSSAKRYGPQQEKN